MTSLNCLTVPFLCQILKIILSTSLENKTLSFDPPIDILINRINNRLALKIKDGYKLELEKSETMKLFGSKKN